MLKSLSDNLRKAHEFGGESMIKNVKSKNSALAFKKRLSFLRLISDSGKHLVNRVMCGIFSEGIRRLAELLGGDCFGENGRCCF